MHELVWALSFVSFYFLYPSTFNILEASRRAALSPAAADCGVHLETPGTGPFPRSCPAVAELRA